MSKDKRGKIIGFEKLYFKLTKEEETVQILPL